MRGRSEADIKGQCEVPLWWWNCSVSWLWWEFPGGSDGKESACNAGDLGLIPGLERSPGEGNGNPLQYSCLENPMDGGAWWATVHWVTKSQTRLSDFTFTFTFFQILVPDAVASPLSLLDMKIQGPPQPTRSEFLALGPRKLFNQISKWYFSMFKINNHFLTVF